MELQKELIDKFELSTDAVTAINTFGLEHTKTKVGETITTYDGKANKDAQGIIDGATNKVKELTGIPLNDKEQIADYYVRAYTESSTTKTSELEASKLAYDTKVADFKGDESITKELNEFKEANKILKGKEAAWDALEKAGFEGRYNESLIKIDTLNESVAYNSVKPAFSQDSNTFEVDAKWKEFRSKTSEKNNIVMHEDVAYAVDKENDLIKTKLEDLVKTDKELTALVSGRQQSGLPAKEDGEAIKIEGVPFDVPANADSSARAKLIREYLAKEGIGSMAAEYTTKFSELNTKIKQGTAK